MMIKKCIVFVINDLDIGGAEKMLIKLIASMNKNEFDIAVVCMKNEGPLSADLTALAIPILYLHVNNGYSFIVACWRLFSYFKKTKPDVVQSWMYHADFMAGIAAKCAGVPRIIWTIRNNKLAAGRSKFSTRLLANVLAKLSFLIPDKIIACAQDVMKTHADIGYCKNKIQVIYNGFDTNLFKKDPAAYHQFRINHQTIQGKICIGSLARYHPDKGIDVFLNAAKLLVAQNSNIVFVLAGLGLDHTNLQLMNQIHERSLNDHILLLGPISDTPRYLASLDIFVSSSLSEGFSNVIGEAMACEVPCVVTNVGDSAYLLSMPDCVVEPNSDQALAQCLMRLTDEKAEKYAVIGATLRKRIIQHFTIISIADQYLSIY